MKQLFFILVLFTFSYCQETTTSTVASTKVIKKGETFKADQDYRLLTVDELKQAISDRADLKTLKLKEIEKSEKKRKELQTLLLEKLTELNNFWLEEYKLLKEMK